MIPYLIKTFRGGLSSESDKGVAGSFKFGENLDIHDTDDVLKCASSVATIDETLVNQIINFFVTAKDGTTYAFGANGSIYAIAGQASDPVVSFAYNDENGAIKGAGEWEYEDGNNYIKWATATSVARVLMNGSKDLPWSGVTADWKTTLDNADWHTMKPAAGSLLIANNNFLAEVDYSGDFDPAALDIIPGNNIKALEERDDYVILGSTKTDRAEEGHIWSWLTSALSWVQKKKIPVKGVNALVQTELNLLQGGAEGEIFSSDFQNITPLHKAPGGGQVSPGGVSIDNDLALFGFYGGTNPGLYTYGRRMRNRPYAFNLQYKLAKSVAGSAISTIGAVAVVNGLALASWGTTDESISDYGIDMVSSTTRATAKYEGLEFDGGKPHEKKTVRSVHVITSPLSSGCSYSIKYKTNKESNWRYAVTGSGATTHSTADSVDSHFTIGTDALIYEVGAELNPSGSSTPEIQAIVTYLAPETNAHG